jgi:hypothetical protein
MRRRSNREQFEGKVASAATDASKKPESLQNCPVGVRLHALGMLFELIIPIRKEHNPPVCQVNNSEKGVGHTLKEPVRSFYLYLCRKIARSTHDILPYRSRRSHRWAEGLNPIVHSLTTCAMDFPRPSLTRVPTGTESLLNWK